MRILRVNKSKIAGDLIAKSRIIIPGHRDPQLGLYRTDAPTTSLIALYLTVLLAVSKGWVGCTFDVTTAFLKSEKMERVIHVRAPRTGLPAISSMPEIQLNALLRMIKGAFGLTDAPRLWYLKARDLVIGIGFEELKCARAVFRLTDQNPRAARKRQKKLQNKSSEPRLVCG